MKELAIGLLNMAGMPPDPEDVKVLADDLATVEFDERLDKHVSPRTTENIFLRRLGGIGNLRSYMKCIRPKGAR